jgi:hypothetical protein
VEGKPVIALAFIIYLLPVAGELLFTGKTLAGKKPYCTATLAGALRPWPFASPLWVRRPFNHCFHLLGGELAFAKEKKEKKMRKKRKRKER